MPFRSEKQRRFMFAKHPAIARRWTEEYGTAIRLKKSFVKAKRRKKRTGG